MSKFDHRFWEISVPQAQLESALQEQDFIAQFLDYVTEEDRDRADADRAELLRQIRAIIDSKLTRRQQQILDLHFFQGKSQQEIAAELGIAQQVVSKQLYGAMRAGEKIGGAMRKIRKQCEKLGLSPAMRVNVSNDKESK